ncbi:MAG: transposase [Opitutales bacterium]|jgi:REP element-mobilizing transposase RayT|nr:transposase [Opitutales bacterium]
MCIIDVGEELAPDSIVSESRQMEEHKSRGYQALRKGRFSQEGASYFLTVCTTNRQKILTEPGVPTDVFNALMKCKEIFDLVASVVMSDHIHIIIKLHGSSLTKAIQVLKSRSVIAINHALNRKGPVWQPTSFDHKFRNDEDLFPILMYMWKNPSPAGLDFRCRNEDLLWFKSNVTKDVEYPSWLKEHPMG